MIEKQTPTDQAIIHFLNTAYPIEVTRFAFLPLGAGINVSKYKATSHDKSYFVKLKQGHHHDNNADILTLLHKAGIQVIPPLKTIEGRTTQHIEDFTLIVYPFVEGQDGFSRHLSDHQWEILGKSLRKLHEINLPQSIQNKIRREVYSPKWRELVRSHYILMENETQHNETRHSETQHNENNQDKIKQDEFTLKFSKFLKEKFTIIRQLVDRAEQLAEKVRVQSPEFVLCHSDIHGGNVLIDDNDIVYIVDWDDPIMAPKERDLMFIGGGVANVWNKPHEEALFYKGYGESEINKTILAYYRYERIVEDIALYIQRMIYSNADIHAEIDEKELMYHQFIKMFSPNGVVDIAFKTDK